MVHQLILHRTQPSSASRFLPFMLLNIDSDVELELPPVCNVKDKGILYEYLLRFTLSVSYVARYFLLYSLNDFFDVALQLCKR